MSEITNPMWDLVGGYPSSHWGLYDEDNSLASYPDLELLLHRISGPQRPSRQWVCVTYAWAIAEPKALEFVAKHTADTGIVEIGAGTGYWAWMLSQLGVDVIAYDRYPPRTRHNFFHNTANLGHDELPSGEERGEQYFSVRRGTHLMAAKHPDRTLFLCWPPMSKMAEHALERYTGDRVVFIGETSGMTGEQGFFDRLWTDWVPIDAYPIVQWEGIHDGVLVLKRAPRE